MYNCPHENNIIIRSVYDAMAIGWEMKKKKEHNNGFIVFYHDFEYHPECL